MGTLIKKTSKIISEKRDDFNKIKSKFNLDNLLDQFKNIKKLGGINTIMNTIPDIQHIKNNSRYNNINDKLLLKQEAIINSMTKEEKNNPKILNASRKLRIAKGSCTKVEEINKLIMQFLSMKHMLKKLDINNAKSNKKKSNL